MNFDDYYIGLKKKWDVILIIILFTVSAVYDYLWIVNNTLPPTWDDAWHLTSSLRYYQILTNPSLDMFDQLIHVDWFYPPFYKFSTAFLYMLIGPSINSSIMINIFYFGILIFSSRGIGKILFNRETGFLAAVIISLYPMIISSRHIYLLDLGLTAMVTLSIYLLLRTENFKSRLYSLAFGAVLGMSLLTKWTSIFFIMGPFSYISYKSFFKIENRVPNNIRKKKLKKYESDLSSQKTKKIWNLVLACAAAILIASIWYVPNGVGVYNWVKEMAPYWAAMEGENTDILSFGILSYYWISLIPQVSFLFTITFVIGFIFLIRIKHENILLLLSWIVLPLIVLTIYLNKNERYSMPVFAAIAIVSSFWLTSISDKKIKIAVISVIILLGGFQVITIASGNNSIHESLNFISVTDIGEISLFPAALPLPKNEDWKHEEVLGIIQKDASTNEMIRGRGSGYIVVLPDHSYINGRTFEYYSFKDKMPFQIYNGAYIGEKMFYENFLNFDYIILKREDNSAYVYKKIVDSEYDYFEKNSNAYLLIYESGLPDGSTLFVYRNRYIK